MPKPLTLLGLLALVASTNLGAQAALPTCKDPKLRQFDFWVGDWVVFNPKRDTAGTNQVTLEEDGCLIHEHWTGHKGGTGQSFNFYDRQDAKWHHGKTWSVAFDGLYRRKT